MTLPSVGRLGLISFIVLITCCILAPLPFQMEVIVELSPAEGQQLVKAIRAQAESKEPAALPPVFSKIQYHRVPLILTLYDAGKTKDVFQTGQRTLKDGFGYLVSKLKKRQAVLGRGRSRIKLDIVTATGWVPSSGPLFSMSFIEGHNGMSAVLKGERVYVSPSWLMQSFVYDSFMPLAKIEKQLKLGMDAGLAKKAIVARANAIGVLGTVEDVKEIKRCAVLSIVEDARKQPRRLLKSTVQKNELTRTTAHHMAIAGAEYLASSINEKGYFLYQLDPVNNRKLGGYNWPRHAGVSYSLALVGRLLKKPVFVQVAGKALERFEQELNAGPGKSQCLIEHNKCYLGSSALGLLALAEYRIGSGDKKFDQSSTKVAEFLMSMQKPNGFFFHEWFPDKGIDKTVERFYASQQAVLALARFSAATGDKKSLAAAERGMDFLAGAYWDFFLGNYFIGPEHWSCLAAEELYRVFPKPEYAEFCYGIGKMFNNMTYAKGETDYPEDDGGMTITNFLTPWVVSTATGAEAMVSAIALGEQNGYPVDFMKSKLIDMYGFMQNGQITQDDTFWIENEDMAIGGTYNKLTQPKIRMDTVQHVICAVARGLHFFDH